MLTIKTINASETGHLEAVYAVSHNSPEQFNTTLTQDLHVRICPRTGAVTGKLIIEDLVGENFDEARARLAIWCDRLAQALREPVKMVSSVPVFERDYAQSSYLATTAGLPGLTWSRLKTLSNALCMSEAATHTAATALYEKGHISYPLSSCEYLPDVLRSRVAATLAGLENVFPKMTAGLVRDTEAPVFLKLFPYAHHAITPEFLEPPDDKLNTADWSPDAVIVYRLIADAYVKSVHLQPLTPEQVNG